MGILRKLIAPVVSNIYEQYTTEQYKKVAVDQGKRLNKMMGMFAPIQDVMYSAGIMSVGGWKEAGQQRVRQEIDFAINQLFEPWIADLNKFEGTMENIYGSYYYKNREGVAVGGWVGGAAGLIIGFLLGGPAGAAWGQQILSWLGGIFGAALQGGILGPYEHPDMPGLPWGMGDTSTPSDDDNNLGEIPHDLPYFPTPISPIPSESQISTRLRRYAFF